MQSIQRSFIVLMLFASGLSYALTVNNCETSETNSSTANPSFDNARTDVNRILENALKQSAVVEEWTTACEAELEDNNYGSSSTFKIGGACSCFRLVSAKFEFARVRLTMALIALSWDQLSKVLESWTLQRDDLKSLDATQERIKILEKLLTQGEDNSAVTN